MPKEFISRLEPQEVQPLWEEEKSRITLFKDSFKLRTLMLFGSLAQIVLFQLLPQMLAILPPILLALYSIITSVDQSIQSPQDNQYVKGMIPGRTTAQIPSTITSLFGYEPATQPVVVFHFGVRFNHPLGVLCPGRPEINRHFFRCVDLVQAQAQHFGLLGLSRWQSGDRDTQNTMMFIFYFREVDGLNRFAHDKAHRDAWEWANKASHKHIGFFHETFHVPRKAYETIYVNMPPTMLGQVRVKCETTDEEKGKWISTLVSADSAPLRTQLSRIGRQ
ncbi:hypothetical protein F4677DRAFT_446415 [Hypoxylon crocopeplum]|nr:hypothetical protein F4677DRAFT_446415 [Hypoxylon crocopeplum]